MLLVLLLALIGIECTQAGTQDAPLQAPLAGQLLDKRTGKPIPSFAIDLRLSSDKMERLVTDEHGVFQSSPLPRVRVSLELIDDDRSPRPSRRGRVRATHNPESAEQRSLEIEVGPTYTVQLVRPDGQVLEPDEAATRFHAELFHDPPRTDGVFFRTEQGAWVTEPAPRAPLRASDGRLWTRFRELSAERRFSGGPWWLEIRDEEGLLAGGTRVDAVHGIYEGEIEVSLTPRAIFEVEGGPTLGTLRDLSRGSFQPLTGEPARWLHLGPVEWVSSRHRVGISYLELPAGRWSMPTPSFGAGEKSAGSIGFHVKEDAATALEESFELWLQAAEFPEAPPRVRSAARELVFDALPAQVYQMTCRGDVPWDGVLLGSGLVAASEEDPAEVVFDLDLATSDFVLLAVDETDGDVLKEAEFCWMHGNYAEWFSSREDGRIRLRDLHSGEWALKGARGVLRAPGYLDSEVDLRALVQSGSNRAYRQVLERGWGTTLYAFDRRSRRPLAGVKALLDGEYAATSEQDGSLRLNAEVIPARLELALEGYQWVDGDPEWLRTEFLAQDEFEPRVWFAPKGY